MSENFVIGSSPIGTGTPCYLKFHEFTIYDSETWTQSGTVKFDAVTKNFYVLPDPPENPDPL